MKFGEKLNLSAGAEQLQHHQPPPAGVSVVLTTAGMPMHPEGPQPVQCIVQGTSAIDSSNEEHNTTPQSSSATSMPQVQPPSPSIGMVASPAQHTSYPASRTIVAMDPASRKLNIPLSAVEHTRALTREGCSALCILHLEGRCRQAAECNQIHAQLSVVEELRAQALRVPDCCPAHGDPQGDVLRASSGLGKSAEVTAVLVSALSVNGILVPIERVAFTRGLLNVLQKEQRREMLAREMSGGQPILPHGTVGSEAAVLPGSQTLDEQYGSPDSNVLMSGKPSVGANIATISPSFVCRLHAAGHCKFVEDCRFTHICREICQAELRCSVEPLTSELDRRPTGHSSVPPPAKFRGHHHHHNQGGRGGTPNFMNRMPQQPLPAPTGPPPMFHHHHQQQQQQQPPILFAPGGPYQQAQFAAPPSANLPPKFPVQAATPLQAPPPPPPPSNAPGGVAPVPQTMTIGGAQYFLVPAQGGNGSPNPAGNQAPPVLPAPPQAQQQQQQQQGQGGGGALPSMVEMAPPPGAQFLTTGPPPALGPVSSGSPSQPQKVFVLVPQPQQQAPPAPQ